MLGLRGGGTTGLDKSYRRLISLFRRKCEENEITSMCLISSILKREREKSGIGRFTASQLLRNILLPDFLFFFDAHQSYFCSKRATYSSIVV